jgi:undecaprenyl diphosphate synthase
LHVAIIMDGNGRWAARRGMPRSAGHVRGARVVRTIVAAALGERIDLLTLYAFSMDNWTRPPAEVAALLRLFRRYLLTETRRCVEQRVRLSVIGRRDRLSPQLLAAIERAEEATATGSRLHLRIALDYSARYSIMEAASRSNRPSDMQEFLRLINEVNHASTSAPRDVDLLIRTGGEQRLSDFLLWECAYAELYFTDCLWPDFDASGLARALADFAGRHRRYGRIEAAAARRN